jgi:ribosomal protein S15P/S13E
LFDELLKGLDSERTAQPLAEIVRVKTVQDFIPSEAICFVFELKQILRDHLKEELQDGKYYRELLEVERNIDRMALLTFDIYVKCSEKLFEIRANEIRNQTHMLIRRVNEMDKQKETR